MFWSHPKPCANSIGCVPRPKTLTLFRRRTSCLVEIVPLLSLLSGCYRSRMSANTQEARSGARDVR